MASKLSCPPWQVSPSLGSANGENPGAGVIYGCGSHWFIVDLRGFPLSFARGTERGDKDELATRREGTFAALEAMEGHLCSDVGLVLWPGSLSSCAVP